jgi:hypothetical protein
MVFDDIRRDLKELIGLVRKSEQYNAAVFNGHVSPTEQMATEDQQRSERIVEIQDKYGLS